MIESRRGFLVGAAKLIGAGLTLAMVPKAMAHAAQPLLWTPEQGEPIPSGAGTMLSRIEAPVAWEAGPLYLTVHRGNPTQSVVEFAFNPKGGMRWVSHPRDAIVYGNGERLEDIVICSTVRPR